jgi:hypothetical protein
VPVIIGGVLNQKMEGDELPVPVNGELEQIGFGVAGSLRQLTARLPKR